MVQGDSRDGMVMSRYKILFFTFIGYSILLIELVMFITFVGIIIRSMAC